MQKNYIVAYTVFYKSGANKTYYKHFNTKKKARNFLLNSQSIDLYYGNYMIYESITDMQLFDDELKELERKEEE